MRTMLMRREFSRLVVKPHRPLRNILLAGMVVMGSLITAWAMFEYGRYHAGYYSDQAVRERDRMEQRLHALEEENADLHQQLSLKERTLQVDRQSYEEVNRSLETLQTENMQLKEEVAFYQGVVSTADSRTGLRLQNFRMTPNVQERSYSYKLILAQLSNSRRMLSGTVGLSIQGTQGGVSKVLTLSQLSRGSAELLKFNLKNFQDLQGTILLPEGFVPLRIVVQIHGAEKGATIEKSFEWSEILAT